MRQIILIIISFLLFSSAVQTQPAITREIRIAVYTPDQKPLPHATVALMRADSSLVRTLTTDSLGLVQFRDIAADIYRCRITMINFKTISLPNIDLQQQSVFSQSIQMEQEGGVLQGVTVTAKKPFLQFLPDKTVINVDAGITNAGTSVLEVLEKSPGVTVDRDGNISMKGRAGVQVMIDGKLTQLSGTDLQNLLSGMNASQIETIELMDNPPAKFDAAGNAGIINIRTKKNKQKGFNGNLTLAYGQGRLPKSNNSVQLNYRNGSFNFFLNYGLNASKNLMDMYALRTYYKDDGSTAAILEQPFSTKSVGLTNTLRTGMDYYLNKKTTLGLVFTGMYLTRDNEGSSTAYWKDQSGGVDSAYNTISDNSSRLKQAGINFNGRHVFAADKELTADIDLIGYSILNKQYFENSAAIPGSTVEATKGEIPSDLQIFSAKADYSQRFKSLQWEAGWKSSRVKTDNEAMYYFQEGGNWNNDLGKSNHFIYTENIHALYSSFQQKKGRWSWQGGLRYEYTAYDAKQMGNAMVKDSSFNRKYNSLFPTAYLTYQLDSLNSITVQAGRRIDRPGFQKLNPFVFIINKYTFQRGNPYFKPQYTWNFGVSHMFRDLLTTSFTYNLTKDYISQIFLSDTSGIIIYTEGNVGQLQNLGVSVSVQIPITKWWNLSGQVSMNHKIIEGQLWKQYKATMTQANINLNNQFRFKKGWSAELSGFYITKNQNDLQEVLDPTGQLSTGVSKQVWKNKGTFRLTFRDMFYTQAMAGWTQFQNTVEYFKLIRDTRVVTFSFTYRFGQSMKGPARRQTGGAGTEMERVGTVN